MTQAGVRKVTVRLSQTEYGRLDQIALANNVETASVLGLLLRAALAGRPHGLAIPGRPQRRRKRPAADADDSPAGDADTPPSAEADTGDTGEYP